MAFLAILLGLVFLATPVALVVLIVAFGRLKRRVEALEAVRVSAGPVPAARPDQAEAAPEETPAAEAPPGEQPPEEPAPPPVPAAEILGPDLVRTRVPPSMRRKEQDAQPRQFVFTQANLDGVTAWLRDNWFLAVAALSLVLAAVFLVQYGIENGLITPFWRVIGAAALGIALIWAGEFIRRLSRDGASGMAYLPSTFSGAGIVALFAAVLAARQLYGLIGPGQAFFWLVAVAAVAVRLGWAYGPFLVVIGLAGSTAAPFLVGGSSDTPELYYYYFALVAVAGLLIDAIRRWAWISAFGLIFAYGAGSYIFTQGAGDGHYLLMALILAFSAVLVPPLKLVPEHSGTTILQAFWPADRPWPEFPTRIAFGGLAASAAAAWLVILRDTGPAEAWAALGALLLMYAATVIWSDRAPAIQDAAVLAPILLSAAIIWQAWTGGSLYLPFVRTIGQLPELPAPRQASILAAMGLFVSALALWRTLAVPGWAAIWAAGAALALPATLIALEIFWEPARAIGAFGWALHAIIAAAFMVLGAERTARQDRGPGLRTSLFALAALVLIAFALIVLFSKTALTLSLALMVAGAVAIDDRYDMKLVARFAEAGAIVVTWRLVIDPGIFWAGRTPLIELLALYGGSIALLTAAWHMRADNRQSTGVILSSAAWLALAVLGTLLLDRFLGAMGSDSHYGHSLLALVWLASAANQLWRLQLGGALGWVRLALACGFALAALWHLSFAIYWQSPLFNITEAVRGPRVFNTLAVAYLLPALPFAFVAWNFRHLPIWFRLTCAWIAGALAALWVGLEIRHIWQGDLLALGGVRDGELYSYTIALMIASVALLFAAFWQRSHGLRRVAVAGIALTIAKVFLIDMSGLAGLYRVASFLGLGLSLAGLAWVVRQMNAAWDRGDAEET